MSKNSISEFKSFIPDSATLKELTISAVLMGIVLGIIFGASSLYLALKVGMTVSASIPVAVLSITLFKGLSKMFGMRRATILENNIVQTTGSAGESIAFGVAVTMPALFILGYDMELMRIMSVAAIGGLLGVLMMIPLRYAMIVKAHGELTYPEGTACAQVLIAGEKGGTSAKTVFAGFFIGLFYKILNVGGRLWLDVPEKAITWFKGASISAEVSPELLGVGYIIGPKISCIMVAGGILSSWVLIPMITLFGSTLTMPLFPATKLISEMSIHEIWRNYVLYIGAGAVAAGGIISLFQNLPTIVRSAAAGLSSIKKAGVAIAAKRRTEADMPITVVFGGTLLLVVLISVVPSLKLNPIGSVLIVLFGFLFTTVSSRLTGQIGSSSNPISGMTVATLLVTSLIFLILGWVGPDYRVAALSVAAVVCVASAVAGATSQDLKTGFLVGATPKFQQLGLLFGALSSAIVIGFTLNLLNDASTVYSKKAVPSNVVVSDVSSLTQKEKVKGPEGTHDQAEYSVLQLTETPKDGPLTKLLPGKYLVDDAGVVKYLVDPGINGSLKQRDDGSNVQKYDAPKARLMSLIIDGILTQKLPWSLVLLGVAIAVVLELIGVASLPFAVGVYLPLASSAPIFVGGMIRWLVDRKRKASVDESIEESETGPGILLSSGLIAGGAIGGIGLAVLFIGEGWSEAINFGKYMPFISESNVTATILFAILGAVLFGFGIKMKKH